MQRASAAVCSSTVTGKRKYKCRFGVGVGVGVGFGFGFGSGFWLWLECLLVHSKALILRPSQLLYCTQYTVRSTYPFPCTPSYPRRCFLRARFPCESLWHATPSPTITHYPLPPSHVCSPSLIWPLLRPSHYYYYYYCTLCTTSSPPSLPTSLPPPPPSPPSLSPDVTPLFLFEAFRVRHSVHVRFVPASTPSWHFRLQAAN